MSLRSSSGAGRGCEARSPEHQIRLARAHANPSIGGASGLENLYVVDGVTITDQAFGSIGTYNRYHGSLGTGINLAFIKEVDVKTTAFEPQYGKATGGSSRSSPSPAAIKYHGVLGGVLWARILVCEPLPVLPVWLPAVDTAFDALHPAVRYLRRSSAAMSLVSGTSCSSSVPSIPR